MGAVTSLGFTGTQGGLTSAQRESLQTTLTKIHENDVFEYHHGDCIGADAEFDELVRLIENTGSTIHIHPPTDNSRVANCQNRSPGTRQIRVHAPKPYLKRNTDIVNDSHMLIACPKEFVEVLRSGTWSTIRRANKRNLPVIIIFPNGTLEFSWLKE